MTKAMDLLPDPAWKAPRMPFAAVVLAVAVGMATAGQAQGTETETSLPAEVIGGSNSDGDDPFDYAIVPHPLLCNVTERCLDNGVCLALNAPPLQSTLRYIDGIWLWDTTRDWDGYPVMVAPTRSEALARHMADQTYGLALIATAEPDDREIVVDVHRLVEGLASDGNARMLASYVRYACRRIVTEP